ETEPKAALLGISAGLITGLIWLPGRATLLMYRKLYPSESRHRWLICQPTSSPTSGTITKSFVEVTPKFPPGRAGVPGTASRPPAFTVVGPPGVATTVLP